jgi:colanic acid/amylovoran biosynthesis glycosyltransferase
MSLKVTTNSSKSAEKSESNREVIHSPLPTPTPAPLHPYPSGGPGGAKVAYIMSRFPKITETFILYEMLALEQQGVAVEVYPLRRERAAVMHPEAKPFVQRAHFQPLFSWSILRAHLQFLRQKPGVYLQTLWTLLRANWGSLRFFGGALAFFPKVVYFAQLMASEGVTHVHAHFASHPAAAAFIIHQLTKIPYSFTAHGSDLHRDQHMLPEKVAEAAFVVPISDYNREIIIAECDGQFGDKVVVIHCGVDTQVFEPPSAPTPHEQGSGSFTMLCIGTLHEVKGQTYLIEACRLLQGRGIDFACHFIGDGPDLAALTKQVEAAGLVEQTHFHGRLTRAEIAALLRGADVVVTPSVPTSNGRREGLPVVLMEAMGSGVPVVASDLSGIPELVIDGQTGLLVAPGDVKGLAKALEQLYRQPELRRRLGQAGREKVTLEFDLYKNAAALAQCFNHTRPVFFGQGN